MDWLQIAQALFLVAMMVYIFPMAKRAMQNPNESKGKWGSILIPLIIVIGIVTILIAMVR